MLRESFVFETVSDSVGDKLSFLKDDLTVPFRRIAVFERWRLVESARPVPRWFKPLLKR
jgi:hypothetical protein